MILSFEMAIVIHHWAQLMTTPVDITTIITVYGIRAKQDGMKVQISMAAEDYVFGTSGSLMATD